MGATSISCTITLINLSPGIARKAIIKRALKAAKDANRTRDDRFADSDWDATITSHDKPGGTARVWVTWKRTHR